MELTEKEKQEIAQMVASILDKRKAKNNSSWVCLRKDIDHYCRNADTKVRWYTLQIKIYDAIRAVLNISRVDDMTDRQAIEARKVFEFIKQEREQWT